MRVLVVGDLGVQEFPSLSTLHPLSLCRERVEYVSSDQEKRELDPTHTTLYVAPYLLSSATYCTIAYPL
jgi:hypothetical protein